MVLLRKRWVTGYGQEGSVALGSVDLMHGIHRHLSEAHQREHPVDAADLAQVEKYEDGGRK